MLNKEFTEWLKLNTDSDNTVKKYYYEVEMFFKSFPEYNQENINKYLSSKVDNISKNSFNIIMSSLKSYGKFIKVNIEFPKQKKPDKTIQEYYTEEEFKKEVLSHINNNFYESKLYTFILNLMFYTGLRAEEVVNIEVEQVNFKDKNILILDTKGKEDREVYCLNDDVFNQLKDFCNGRTGKIFTFDYSHLYNIFRKINEGSGLKYKLHPHLLRRCFAKHCVRLNINISVIQKLMGHKDIKTTILYAEPDRNIVKEACEIAKKQRR